MRHTRPQSGTVLGFGLLRPASCTHHRGTPEGVCSHFGHNLIEAGKHYLWVVSSAFAEFFAIPEEKTREIFGEDGERYFTDEELDEFLGTVNRFFELVEEKD